MLELLAEHWAEAALLALGVAAFIARLTPTPKDDKVLGIVGRFLAQIIPGGLSKGANSD